jgi:hypothetical protein
MAKSAPNRDGLEVRAKRRRHTMVRVSLDGIKLFLSLNVT